MNQTAPCPRPDLADAYWSKFNAWQFLQAPVPKAGSGLDLWIGSDIHPKLVAVDEQTNDHIVQPDRLRKTNRFAS